MASSTPACRRLAPPACFTPHKTTHPSTLGTARNQQLTLYFALTTLQVIDSPTMDSRLIELLGLSPEVRRLSVQQMGW